MESFVNSSSNAEARHDSQSKSPVPELASRPVDTSLDVRLVSKAMGRRWRILIVDDDEDFHRVFVRAVEKSRMDADLFGVKDGPAAIDYLLGDEPYADRERFPFPDLVFVDLKMPRMDGLALLKKLRTKVGLQDLPIIVLTGSDAPTDVASAYSLSASAFHHKPSSFDGLVSMVKTVVPLWLHRGARPQIPFDVRKEPFGG
jgi:two-component system response regulator